jgi:hypothetical protein
VEGVDYKWHEDNYKNPFRCKALYVACSNAYIKTKGDMDMEGGRESQVTPNEIIKISMSLLAFACYVVRFFFLAFLCILLYVVNEILTCIFTDRKFVVESGKHAIEECSERQCGEADVVGKKDRYHYKFIINE